jgi:hypothetical protein
MHCVPFLTLTFTLLSTASAYAVPANQPDGLYQVRRSSSGHEIHESLGVPLFRRTATTSFSETKHLTKRDLGHTHCGCGSELSHKNTDDAVADLAAKLVGKAQWMKPSSSIYSIRGDVVAYVCNKDGNGALRAWKEILRDATKQISAKCGNYIVGGTGGPFAFSMGYMKYRNVKDGMDFCGDSLKPPKDAC